MPIYNLKHPETGEVEEYMISISKYEEMKEQGYVQEITNGHGFISQNGGTLGKTSGDWRNHLKNIKKGSGKSNTIKTY